MPDSGWALVRFPPFGPITRPRIFGAALLIVLLAASAASADPMVVGSPLLRTRALHQAAFLLATAQDAEDVEAAADILDGLEEDDVLFDDDFDATPVGYADPLEPSNRVIFAFNEQIDRFVLHPITRAYRFIFPEMVRRSIHNFFENIDSTKTLVNDLLQLEWEDAAVTTSRLVINSTAGIAGLFDVADMMGLEGHSSDFGQTLALAGTPSGPYFVMPLLGPSTPRDTVGTGVDGLLHPTFYILGPLQLVIYNSSTGFLVLESQYLQIKALKESSVDYYAALRNGYYQNRIAQIWGRRQGHRTNGEP